MTTGFVLFRAVSTALSIRSEIPSPFAALTGITGMPSASLIILRLSFHRWLLPRPSCLRQAPLAHAVQEAVKSEIQISFYIGGVNNVYDAVRLFIYYVVTGDDLFLRVRTQ